MPQSARVSSVEALDAFKASLVVFLEKAGRLLDEASEGVVRTRTRLESDRLLHWKNQSRQRTRELAQAEQELLTARLSDMPEAIKARRMAVNRAKLALQEAEDGLARVKHWIRNYATQVESHAKLVTQLRHSLAHDMIKAVVFLETAATTLAAYAETSPPLPATAPGLDPKPQSDREQLSLGPAPEPSAVGNSPDANPCPRPSRQNPRTGRHAGESGPTLQTNLPSREPRSAGATAGPPVPEGGSA